MKKKQFLQGISKLINIFVVAIVGVSGFLSPAKTVMAAAPSIPAAAGTTNLLQDPSFEASYGSTSYWSQSSTIFGTPLCSVDDCGGTGSRTGSIWGWFGGTASDDTSSLSQTVIIPNGSADLEFYLWIQNADTGSDLNDVFTAKIDGVTVFSANATQTSSYPIYTLVSVDVSAYADGATHEVTFSSVTTDQIVNFFLDDVALLSDAPSQTLTVSKNGAGSGTVTSSPTGINSGSICSYDFVDNTSVTLTASAANGSTFAGWSGAGCSDTGTCTVTMNATKSVSATFNTIVYQTLTISKNGVGSGTVTSSPSGINCGSTCSYGFVDNTSVTLTANAASGSTFAGWNGAGCSGTGTCTVTMNASQSVTATFNIHWGLSATQVYNDVDYITLSVQGGSDPGSQWYDPNGNKAEPTCGSGSGIISEGIDIQGIIIGRIYYFQINGCNRMLGQYRVRVGTAIDLTFNIVSSDYRLFLPLLLR